MMPFLQLQSHSNPYYTSFPSGSVGENLSASAGDAGELGSTPRIRKIPWRRKWQPTPAFLPGKSHGQEPGRLQCMGSQESDRT